MTAPQSGTSGRFFDLRQLPPGVVPRHLQQWVLLAIALVMIGILTVSGPSPKPRPTPQASPAGTTVDPNQQRIEDYQRRIQEQAQRLAAEQAQLQLAKEAAPQPAAATQFHSGVPVPGHSSDARAVDNVAFSRSPAARQADSPLSAGTPNTEPPPAAAGVSPVTPAAAPPAPPAPARQYVLLEGTVIETVLTNRLDGTFNGPVNCLVSVPAYASDHLVIPAGARVLGEAAAVNTFGQSRLAVVFHRLIQPNGARVNLDQFRGLNQVGDGGLHDEVDRHYFEIFGASLALGAVAGFAQARSPVGLDVTAFDTYRQGVSASVSQSSARVLDRFLNLLPTVTIREGHRIKVYLSRDLALPAYRDPGMTGGQP